LYLEGEMMIDSLVHMGASYPFAKKILEMLPKDATVLGIDKCCPERNKTPTGRWMTRRRVIVRYYHNCGNFSVSFHCSAGGAKRKDHGLL
jgi:hypothetical protein